jgi:protein SCO1/2
MGMLGVLVVAWWSEVQGSLKKVATSASGRTMLVAVGLMAATGLTAAGVRVVEARQLANWSLDDLAVPLTYPRLDRRAPAFALTDQSGNRVSLQTFAGRPVLVTFGFGHCETVCPLVVHNARLVQEALGDVERPVLVVITLDPWRDTPSRLLHLMDQWALGAEAFVLGGSVDEVNGTLDAWKVARERDTATGDITHLALTFIVDPEGRLAYATTGDRDALLDLLENL